MIGRYGLYISLLFCSTLMAEIGSDDVVVTSDKDASIQQSILKKQWSRNNVWTRDKNTQLMWQDTSEMLVLTKTWEDATRYCDILSLGGYTDWTLPNYSELLSLVDYNRYDPSIEAVFRHVDTANNYWSSTQHIEDTSGAWIVYFYNGSTYIDTKNIENAVRCVRQDKGH